MAARIGMIAVGHPDYQNDIGLQFARAAAEELRGHEVEVVTDGQAYTDPVSAMQRGQEMAGQRLDGVIVWLNTWIECSTALAAIRELEHLPFAIWGFNMFEWEGKRESTGSFVAACVLKGALDRMDYPFKLILGLPEDEAAVQSAVAFSRAAHAVQALKRTRLGLVGYAAMAMYPGTFDHVLLRRIIGPEVVHLDTYTLIRTAEQLDDDAVHTVAEELALSADEIAVDRERLMKASRLAAALGKLADDHKLGAMNVKCQYELSQQYGMTACIPISWLADRGIVSACEGDVVITATMCLLSYLTDQTVYYGDILDLQGDQMLLSSCGFAPMSLAHEGDSIRICELGHPGFDGIICSFTLRRGPVTFARLVEGRGDYRLNYGTGTGVDTQLRQGRFPGLEIRLDGDPQKLMATMASQHFAICYGDVTESIEDLCRTLGIEAVRI